MKVKQWIDKYQNYLEERGLKKSSIENAITRLKVWFKADENIKAACQQTASRYSSRGQRVSVSTARNDLRAVKVFQAYLVSQNVLRENYAGLVQPVGRPNKGKPQLRASEAKRFLEVALDISEHGNSMGLALSMALLMGLRSGEIRNIMARDIDQVSGKMVLWIDQGKTVNAARQLEVPDVLHPGLNRLLNTQGLIFGETSKVRLIRWCKRICALAGVPTVTPHGLRGTFASLAVMVNTTPSMVAEAMGHGSFTTTSAHYATQSSIVTGNISHVVDRIE